MHNVVVENNSRFTYDSDSDSDSDDDDVTRACAPSNYDDDDDDDDIPQRACAPSSIQRACAPIQRACAPSNDNDINNFCITDETPFSSENVNTILKSFSKN